MTPTCATCHHHIPDTWGQGKCKEGPPTPMADGTAVWPTTALTDGCTGRWRPREGTEVTGGHDVRLEAPAEPFKPFTEMGAGELMEVARKSKEQP